jgi:hypothetical protein
MQNKNKPGIWWVGAGRSPSTPPEALNVIYTRLQNSAFLARYLRPPYLGTFIAAEIQLTHRIIPEM